MKKSILALSLGRIAGIEITLHWSFLIMIVLFTVFLGWKMGVFLLVGFACVVLHELGHALVARLFKIRTERIVLLPIGGLAQLERIPTNPWQELLIALAGPMVNAVLLGATLLTILIFDLPFLELLDTSPESNEAFQTALIEPHYLHWQLVFFNLFLFGFNLIPAFPMDGGRVLRALLATGIDYIQATRIAARIGQGFAVAFFIFALLNPQGYFLLMLVAFFIFLSGGAEVTLVRTRKLLHGRKAREAMITEFDVVEPLDPLWKVVDLMKKGHQSDFPVCRDGRVFGVLTRTQALEAYRKHGPGVLAGDIPFTEIEAIDVEAPLEEVLELLQSSSSPLIPVESEGRLAGVITGAGLDRFGAMIEAIEQGDTGQYQH